MKKNSQPVKEILFIRGLFPNSLKGEAHNLAVTSIYGKDEGERKEATEKLVQGASDWAYWVEQVKRAGMLDALIKRLATNLEREGVSFAIDRRESIMPDSNRRARKSVAGFQRRMATWLNGVRQSSEQTCRISIHPLEGLATTA